MKRLEKIIERKGKKFLFRVEKSDNHKDYLKYEQLRDEIWGFPDDSLPGSRNMMCENIFYDGSSLFIAVYSETGRNDFSKLDFGHLVGFTYGFVGVMDKKVAFRSLDNLQFYSQYTGVRKDLQNYGLGILIKEFQKEKLLDIFGIHKVTCTYDPLTGVNAHRNIHHFGMDVIHYRVDMYGDFGGYLNREDIPSDRFIMLWDLNEDPQKPAYDLESLLDKKQIVTEVAYAEVQGKSGPLEFEVIKDLNLSLDQEFLLVEIPFDFYKMLRETDVEDRRVREIPLQWRVKTRQVFQDLFQRGYKVIDFQQEEMNKRKKDFYILKRYD